jgi:hypothetical protein
MNNFKIFLEKLMESFSPGDKCQFIGVINGPIKQLSSFNMLKDKIRQVMSIPFGRLV